MKRVLRRLGCIGASVTVSNLFDLGIGTRPSIGRSWLSGASIETTLEFWASSLRDVKAQIRQLFTQQRVSASAGLFLAGLLGDERRRTGWMRAEAAGDPGPWRQQAILGRSRRYEDALRDVVRGYVVEHSAATDAVRVIDETGFLKQGRSSCGVSRQYTGSARKITNCQIGVFAALDRKINNLGDAITDGRSNPALLAKLTELEAHRPRNPRNRPCPRRQNHCLPARSRQRSPKHRSRRRPPQHAPSRRPQVTPNQGRYRTS